MSASGRIATRPLGTDEGKCAFTQPCSSYQQPGCHPVNITNPAGYKPFPVNVSAPACPQYADAGCCNADQNIDLSGNFFLIKLAFGPPGGCDACVQNLFDFWCAFTCSPRQAEFVEVVGLTVVPDPLNGNKPTTVLETNMKADPYYACAMFAACKGTSVAQSGGLTICEQFFDFQAKQSAISKGSYTNLIYTKPSEDPTTLSQAYYDCCNYPKNMTDWSQGNTSCPCATCAGTCGTEPCYSAQSSSSNTGPAIDNPDIGVMNGFYAPAIIGLYSALAAMSVAMITYQSGICRRDKDGPVIPTQKDVQEWQYVPPHVAQPVAF